MINFTNSLKTTVLAISMLFVATMNGKIERKDKSFDVKVGDTFTLSLSAKPSTGHTWGMLVNQPAENRWIELVKSEYIPDKPARIGSGGKRTFTFKAIREGIYGVPLYYTRRDEKPKKIVSLKVNIKPQNASQKDKNNREVTTK